VPLRCLIRLRGRDVCASVSSRGYGVGGVMRFLAITLIVHAPDLVTGATPSTAARFRQVARRTLAAASA